MQSAPIHPPFVRQLFSQPHKRVAADFLYREIANRMAERLQLIRLHPRMILDAGCGTGADMNLLQQTYQNAQTVGIDGAVAMLQNALNEQAKAAGIIDKLWTKLSATIKAAATFSAIKQANQQFIAGDFAQLPLPTNALQLVWSNLALHWHHEPDVVFKEWRRVLDVNGLLMFSCLGPDSLKEIRAAFDDLPTPITLPFVDMHDFGDMLVQAGFATPVMDMEVIKLSYQSVPQLLAEVRALGGNPLSTRRKGLMGKKAWHIACQRLDKMRNAQGRIELTLEIIYGHAFNPEPKAPKSDFSVIKFDRLNKS